MSSSDLNAYDEVVSPTASLRRPLSVTTVGTQGGTDKVRSPHVNNANRQSLGNMQSSIMTPRASTGRGGLPVVGAAGLSLSSSVLSPTNLAAPSASGANSAFNYTQPIEHRSLPMSPSQREAEFESLQTEIALINATSVEQRRAHEAALRQKDEEAVNKDRRYKDELAACQAELEHAIDATDDYKRKYEIERDRNQKGSDGMIATVARLETELAASKAKLATVTGEMEVITLEREELIAENKRKLETLTRQHEEALQRKTELLIKREAKLQADMAELQSRLESAERRATDASAQHGKLADELSKSVASLSKITAQNKQMSGEREELLKMNVELTDRVEAMKAEHDTMVEQLTKKNEELSVELLAVRSSQAASAQSNEDQMTELGLKYEETFEKWKVVSEELEIAKVKVSQMQKHVELITKERDHAVEQKESVIAASARAQAQLAIVERAALQAVIQERDALKKEVSHLQMEVAKLDLKLSAASDERLAMPHVKRGDEAPNSDKKKTPSASATRPGFSTMRTPTTPVVPTTANITLESPARHRSATTSEDSNGDSAHRTTSAAAKGGSSGKLMRRPSQPDMLLGGVTRKAVSDKKLTNKTASVRASKDSAPRPTVSKIFDLNADDDTSSVHSNSSGGGSARNSARKPTHSPALTPSSATAAAHGAAALPPLSSKAGKPSLDPAVAALLAATAESKRRALEKEVQQTDENGSGHSRAGSDATAVSISSTSSSDQPSTPLRSTESMDNMRLRFGMRKGSVSSSLQEEKDKLDKAQADRERAEAADRAEKEKKDQARKERAAALISQAKQLAKSSHSPSPSTDLTHSPSGSTSATTPANNSTAPTHSTSSLSITAGSDLQPAPRSSFGFGFKPSPSSSTNSLNIPHEPSATSAPSLPSPASANSMTPPPSKLSALPSASAGGGANKPSGLSLALRSASGTTSGAATPSSVLKVPSGHSPSPSPTPSPPLGSKPTTMRTKSHDISDTASVSSVASSASSSTTNSGAAHHRVHLAPGVAPPTAMTGAAAHPPTSSAIAIPRSKSKSISVPGSSGMVSASLPNQSGLLGRATTVHGDPKAKAIAHPPSAAGVLNTSAPPSKLAAPGKSRFGFKPPSVLDNL